MEALSMDQLDIIRRERLALSKLTDKQKLFCEEYVRSFDKLAALKAGGYWTPKMQGGSQEKLVQTNFDRLMESAVVGEYLNLLKQSVASRLGVSMDTIVDEYKAMAFTNMDDYVEWTNSGITSFKSSDQLTRAQKAGILEITETTTKSGTVIKIKLHNKQAALDRLFEVLKELEAHETRKDGPAQISQTQINVILQDPMKRRAVEHLAESMFDKQISLVGTDKDRIEFDRRMEKITTKLLEAAGGSNSAKNTECKRIEASGIGEAESKDQGNYRKGDCAEKDQGAVKPDLRENDAEGAGDGEEGGEEPEPAGSRYAIDGL